MEETKKIINWGQVLSYSIIVLLTLECIFLILQNRDLKQTLNSTSSVAQVEPLKPGDKVESCKMTNLESNIGELSYDDPAKKYLLFVLSTTCPHCE